MDETFRTIDELIALYQVEPETRDVFVEGITDKLLVERFVAKNSLENVKVIEAQEVNFKSLYEEFPEIRSNNKAKLIALNKKLESEFGENLQGISIIIDKDIDDFLGNLITGFYLTYTDYNSIELYMFNENVINIFYKNIMRGFPVNGKRTIEILTPILNDKFLVRVTLKKDNLIPENKFIPFNKTTVIDKKNQTIDFVAHDHIQKVLNNVKLMSQRQVYFEIYDDLKTRETKEIKNLIRGHDFITLFYHYVSTIKNSIGLTLDTLERFLFQSIDFSELKKEPLFLFLLNKYSV